MGTQQSSGDIVAPSARAALQQLVTCTGHARTRARLLSAGAPVHLSDLLPSLCLLWRELGGPCSCQCPVTEQLLDLLRVLRNLCAAGSEASSALVDCSVPQQVAALVLVLESHSACRGVQGKGALQLLTVAAQLLANLAASGAAAACAVWAACQPRCWQALAGVSASSVRGPLCRALHLCCGASEECATQLNRNGAWTLRALLLHDLAQARLLGKSMGPATSESAHDATHQTATLFWDLTVRSGLLPELLTVLASDASDARPAWQLHQALFTTLALAADEHADRHCQAADPSSLERSLRGLVEVATSYVQAVTRTPAEAPALRAALVALRGLSSVDTSAVRRRVLTGLQSACLPGLLLAMLVALGPVARLRPAPTCEWGQRGAASTRSSNALDVGVHADVVALAAALPARPPYAGYRTDVVAVLANALHASPPIQQDVLRLGGIPVLLSQCQVDAQSPWLREWALWGVRNLCEDNPSAQAAVAEMQPQAPAASPELQELNMRVELDRPSGRVSVVREHGKKSWS